MSSFRKINYKLRPAKSVERKMIADAVRLLTVFQPLKNYQYIGFGSIYFADFSLFHRTLGIEKMISIEQNFSAENRVNFNKPFSCIDVKFENSLTALPKIDLKSPSIIWLDYDNKISSDILSDIDTVITNIQTKSILLISVNIQAESLPTSDEKPSISIQDYRLNELERQIGKAKIPLGVSGKDLSPKSNHQTIRSVIIDEIQEALSIRNGIASNDSEKITFQQIFNFKYEDGAPMLTIGGIFLNEELIEDFNFASFENLDFYRSSEQSYEIEIPSLTNKETAYLDSIIHEKLDFSDFSLKNPVNKDDFIPEKEMLSYAKIYRYYPTFAEAIW